MLLWTRYPKVALKKLISSYVIVCKTKIGPTFLQFPNGLKPISQLQESWLPWCLICFISTFKNVMNICSNFFLLLFSFKQKRMEYFLTPFPIFFFDSTIRRFQNYTIWINTVLYLALPKEENLPKISSWGIPWSNRHHQEWSGPFLLSPFSILNSQFSILWLTSFFLSPSVDWERYFVLSFTWNLFEIYFRSRDSYWGRVRKFGHQSTWCSQAIDESLPHGFPRSTQYSYWRALQRTIHHFWYTSEHTSLIQRNGSQKGKNDGEAL